jgi:hypothetical protein
MMLLLIEKQHKKIKRKENNHVCHGWCKEIKKQKNTKDKTTNKGQIGQSYKSKNKARLRNFKAWVCYEFDTKEKERTSKNIS